MFSSLLVVVAMMALTPSSAFAQAKASSGYFEPFEIANSMNLEPGDILIDTAKRRLYFAYDDELVLVYPVAVGREGALWKGSARIGRMVDGPAWYPTADQRKRKNLPARVAPGPNNPLGDYALYLFKDDVDTLIRIHGTNNPSSIGKAVSDGCFRMRNEHIEELYGYVSIGARVTVR